MSMSMKNLLLLAKVQSAKGTPSVPTAGANAILCRGLTPQPLKAKFVERNLIRGAKGNYGAIVASEHRVFEFEVELAGAGAAGSAPKFAPLLLGCAMSETLSAGVSAVYQPVATVGTYLTLYAYLDGVLFTMTDALGTFSLSLNAEEIPVMKFTFMGKYAAVTDTAFPSGISFTGFTQPVTVGDANTSVFTLDAVALVVKSFGLDLANQTSWVDLINDSGVRNPDRKPTASATFEMTTVATKDWAGAVVAGTQMPLAITHGLTAGNIVSIAAPKLQFNAEPSLSNDAEVAMMGASFAVMPNAGNDELVLTFT